MSFSPQQRLKRLLPRLGIVLLAGLVAGSLEARENSRSAGPRQTQDYGQQVPTPRAPTGNQNIPTREFGQGQVITPQEWSRQYSPLGTRRARVSGETRDRPVLEQNTLRQEVMRRPELNLQERQFFHRNLREDEQLSREAVSDPRIFEAHLPINRRLVDRDGEIDLEAVNRYVHRRNQPDGVQTKSDQVQQAGGSASR